MRKLFAVGILALSALVTQANAQTTYNSSVVFLNIGEPGWGTFIFGGNPNTHVGSTELIIQCDHFSRAELILNFQVRGEQRTSQFFPINCTPPAGGNSRTVNNTPFTVNLTMQGYDSDGSPVSFPLALTVGPTSWQWTGYGRYLKATGSSEITY